MTFEKCKHTVELIELQCGKDQDLCEMRDDLTLKAARYGRSRVDWFLAGPGGRPELDTARSPSHNVLVDSCNALSRLIAERQLANSWRELLGDDRPRTGDFACYLHAFMGIVAG